MNPLKLAALLLVCLVTREAFAAEYPTKFDLTKDAGAYTSNRGHGWDFDSKPGTGQPCFFSVAAGEGNYRVKLRIGDASKAATTTVKAESRRLMLESIV